MANEYKTWQRSTAEHQGSTLSSKTRYTRKARFFMLVWLVGNRHMIWAWRAGAWSRIAADRSTRLRQVNKNIGLWNGSDARDSIFKDMVKPFDGSNHSACDYVLKFMDQGQRHKKLDPFALESKREKVRNEVDIESQCVKPGKIKDRITLLLLAILENRSRKYSDGDNDSSVEPRSS